MSDLRASDSQAGDLIIQEKGDAVSFAVRVQPRAARTEVAGVHAGALKVRLHAPPVDGAANEALVEFLSERLGVPARRVRIIRGTTARLKTVEVQGVSRQYLHRLMTSN